MKKTIVIVVVVAMFGWAVYDLTINDDEEQADDFTVEEDNASEEESNGNEAEDNDDAKTDQVGLSVGNIAPDFELETMEGDTIQLSDLRGERVMVNFWASWCPPCRAEVPDLKRFYDNKDIEILAVNLTDTENSIDDVKQFAEEEDMNFPILLDENTEVANTYQIQPVPTSFMIDSDGHITFRAFGPLNYELMVQQFEKMS